MKSILAELYKGNLSFYDEKTPILDEYKAAFLKKEEMFIEKLEEPLKEEFENLVEDYFTCFPVEMSEEFSKGFKLATRLIFESLSEEPAKLE